MTVAIATGLDVTAGEPPPIRLANSILAATSSA
jgi:hypothetical protein